MVPAKTNLCELCVREFLECAVRQSCDKVHLVEFRRLEQRAQIHLLALLLMLLEQHGQMRCSTFTFYTCIINLMLQLPGALGDSNSFVIYFICY